MGTRYTWMNPKLEVIKSEINGKGVFAKENIKKNERLAIFGGYIISIDEIKNIPESFQDYTLQIEERFVLSAEKNDETEPEDSDFFNHNCEPNSGFKGQIFLVAMRDIKKGEEITFDYAMVVSESEGSEVVFEMECNCGAKNCRKKITENDWKNPDIQKKYNGFFSQYLQEKIDSH